MNNGLSDTDWRWLREAERNRIIGQLNGLLAMGHFHTYENSEFTNKTSGPPSEVNKYDQCIEILRGIN